MTQRVLITGGAGFVGSHLADDLVSRGHRVRVLDNLDPHVHGGDRTPSWRNDDVEWIVGDVRDAAAVERSLDGVDAVFHFAAAAAAETTSDVERCTSINDLGTRVLTSAIANKPVERLVLASSMVVYGEGLYRDSAGLPHEIAWRTHEQLASGQWEPLRGDRLAPAPTPETKSISVGSSYACSKYDQELRCVRLAQASEVRTFILRLFNVFGPRQTSANPYSDELARFVTSVLSGVRPCVPEDGRQRRDFTPVRDAVTGCRMALEAKSAPLVLNIATGRSRTLSDMALRIATLAGRPDLIPEATREYRVGDVRHCFADVSLARRSLGYEATTDLDGALRDLIEWIAREPRRVSMRPAARRPVAGSSERGTLDAA